MGFVALNLAGMRTYHFIFYRQMADDPSHCTKAGSSLVEPRNRRTDTISAIDMPVEVMSLPEYA